MAQPRRRKSRETELAVASDAELVERVLKGHTDTFEYLLKRYEPRVLAIAKRHVPKDWVAEVAQEAFIRAFRSLGRLKDATRFKYWLATIATRACYDFWRQRYRSKEVPLSGLDADHQRWLNKTLAIQAEEKWRQKGRRKEARRLLEWTLAQLSAADRMVIELVYLEGLSHQKAAELLGFSRASVKVRAFRARKKIHQLLLQSGRRP